MKFLLKTTLLFSLLAPALLSCDKDDDNDAKLLSGTVSFTLNGDGFNNQTFTENVTSEEAPVPESGVNGAVMLLAVGTYTRGEKDRKYWSSYVEGVANGTYSWASAPQARRNSCQVLVWKNGQEATYLHYLAGGAQASGSTIVTKFDPVNARIGGTFAGKLYNDDTDVPVTLTNGKFSVTRKADVP
jgi:hypothetical protein